MNHIINFYDEKRIEINKVPIPINIVHTDAAPGQYKCRQIFYKVSTFSNIRNHACCLIHKFAQKYRFKGSWDAVGKVVKERIRNHELNEARCANAWDCYILLRKTLVDKVRRKKLFEKLDFYESNGDPRVIENTTFTTKNTYVGFGTESYSEYESLNANDDYDNIIFIDRSPNQPDIHTLDNTMLLSEVKGHPEPNSNTGKWTVTTSTLQCACLPCRTDPVTADNHCMYKNDRNLRKYDIRIKGENADVNNDEDPMGMQTMKKDDLIRELHERGVTARIHWKKDKLIQLLTEVIEDELNNEDNLPEDDDDVDDSN